jgi:radical SAM superfamily enzyme YgiQ (UPF0313 family)
MWNKKMEKKIIQFNKIFVEPKKNLTIAFINPPHADWALVNTLTYFLCKSYYDRYGKYKNHVEWLEPLYKWDSYISIQEIYDQVKAADVIMFSSYIWNYPICDDLAKLAKADGKITVMGGPHVGTNEPEFFNSRDFYDFVCIPTKPGEIFIEDFIDQWFETDGQPLRENISWEVRSDKKRDYRFDDIDYSVYEDHLDYMKKILDYAKVSKLEPYISFETTRGCPYRCVFCEWGGGIATKIYKKPIDIVKRDIIAMKNAGFFSANLTDANFGVFLDRDIEILKFAWDNHFNLTDISAVKTKDLKKRKKIIDAWFNVIQRKPISDITTPEEMDMWNRTKHLSVVPTVSFQSVSEDAMKIANRTDLNLKDKIELSRYIGERTRQAGYPIPALELILGLPGSTIDDFYKEMEIIWNFRSWGMRRHDYMFLPDSELTSKDYIEKYKIKLVEVYTDSGDEDGQENLYKMYRNKKSYFKTLVECFSYTHEEFLEMVFMNHAASYLLMNIYAHYEDEISPSEFAKKVYQVVKELDGFDKIHNYLKDLYNPNTQPKCITKINGEDRVQHINNFLEDNLLFIKNGIAIDVLLN